MDNKTFWIETHVMMNPLKLEEISAELFGIGCQGIEEEKDGFKIYFAGSDWNPDIRNKLLNLLKRTNPEFNEGALKTIRMPSENWNEEWKKKFRPFTAAPGLIIQPDWECVTPQPGEQVITIAPKMAFGTGHHETTRLMLRLIKEFLRSGDRVLDLGTGSGILAVYALKCRAGYVVAVDVDPEAIRNLRENCLLNDTTENITAVQGTLKDLTTDSRFDLILANINKNVLLELARFFDRYLKAGGQLILSGIMDSDEEQLIAAYQHAGWKQLKSIRENEWVGMVMGKEEGI